MGQTLKTISPLNERWSGHGRVENQSSIKVPTTYIFYHLKPHREIKFRTSIIHYASAISLVSLLTQKAYQFIESATYTSYKAEL